ncbi:MAG TPA: S8 family serine peptidase [Micromonosporaceae bacterium]|nr:S8 family serine peptidase [Micromonosporaceae bacterium]
MISLTPRAGRRRKLLTATAVGIASFTALGGALVVPSGAQGAPTPRITSTAAAYADAAHTVTLITGDVVRVFDVGGGKQAADVTRPHGAPGGVRTETIHGDLFVFPDEAVPYLAAGVLDRDLFDVTALIKDGYDDAHSPGIPMIVSYAAPAPGARAQQVTPPGTTRVRSLPSLRGAAISAPKHGARGVWQSIAPEHQVEATTSAGGRLHLGDGIAKVWLDGRVRADLAESTAQIGAPAAWAAGYDGSGIKVAVLDTGADLNHPDLAGRVSQAVSFVPGEDATDGHGHGTHTLSTVGGSGAASGGVEKGVAPGANLLVGKVLGNDGFGDDSWIIAGMEWAVAQGAKVVSMSLGGTDPSDGTDPMSEAVDQLSAQSGTLFVIAAGNFGAEAAISSPGAADAALTVGAVDSADQLAWFSSMGPRYGDYALKPDISAPGVDILAALAGGNDQVGWYQTMSGTSMATPHVAGAAAILAQEHPDWTGQQIKDALMSTAKELAGTTEYQVGTGRVDVAAAVATKVTATGSAYFGFDGYPHDDAAPVDRTVTYTNTGDAGVTLDLSMSAQVAGGPYDVDPTADAGTPAPDGMFTLSASQLTVPAHGTASVTAAARPGLGADGRRYLGEIAATDTAGGATVHTGFGLYKEDARYNMHIVLKDRAGHPASGWVELQQFGVSEPNYVFVPDTGVLDARLRAGTYSMLTWLDLPGVHGPDTLGLALLGNPQVVLDRDRSVTLDARKAREATAKVSKPTEDREMIMTWYRSDGGNSVIDDQYLVPAMYDSMWVLPTQKATLGAFEYETRWRKAYPLLTLTAGGKPVPSMGIAGSSFYDGDDQLGAVYAGTGTPAEYAGVHAAGKAVLVTYSPDVTGVERAQAAAAAHAKLLIVVNNVPGKLFDWVGNDDGSYSAVPVITLTALVGAPLVAAARKGGLTLHVHGVPNSPYVYDLVDPHAGQIPSDLTYRPKASDLTTVNMRFFGTKSYDSGEFRWSYRPYRTVAVGLLERMTMPGTRVDYVSAQPGNAWAEDMMTGPNLELESRSGIFTYPHGKPVTSDWFAPVAHPANGSGFWWSDRQQSYMEMNIQPWTDNGPDHGGYMSDGQDILMNVYQDGTLVSSSTGYASASIYPIPTVAAKYTVDLRASRDASVFPLSTRTHTVWQINSNPVTDPFEIALMPFLQLNYQVTTDLAGNAKGGRQTLGLTAAHLPGVVDNGKVMGAHLSVSFDNGLTWRPVKLVKDAAGRWTTTFDAPPSGYVSLRAYAWDSKGNSVNQTIIRAYGLGHTVG